MPYSVIVADDEKIAREGISRLLEQTDDFQVVATTINGPETLKKTLELEPDILLLDIQMPPDDVGGMLVFRELKTLDVSTKVLVLTRDELAILTIKEEGGSYMPKSADQMLVSAMRQLLNLPAGVAVQSHRINAYESVLGRIKRAGLNDVDQQILGYIIYETKEIARLLDRDDRYVRDRLSSFIYPRLKEAELIDPDLPVPLWRQAEAVSRLGGLLEVPRDSIIEKAYRI